ncbi:hypothetical protein [Haloechinothrix sp. LS1_15]|uniref:hypothetical protein n=1 Tax=Haloechinothrix sp. LS1_15 TaxID=2652248 RepID=UPI00294730B9|nr:hypothetical protein [Haloechinothrix sp. LS1_15]MDV6011062.1 hypothetical protein [Haloechinothrix sp. LS1_15]
MPRPESAEAASSLAEAWHAELAAWVKDMRSYGDKLHDSADTYEANEAAAERAFGEVAVGDMRPT